MKKHILKKHTLACLAAAALLALAASPHAPASSTPKAAPPGVVMVGDPRHPETLARQVQDAYDAGARRIAVRPGMYLLPDVGHTSLSLHGWDHATLSGTGAILILTDLAWMHDGIDLDHCTHVTVQGFLLSQAKVTAYQGRVIAQGKNDAGKPYCNWRPDTGYPVPPDTEKGFLGGNVNIVDAHTRLLKVGCGDHYGVAAEPQPQGTFRAHMGGNFKVGDWLVGRWGNAPFKVYLSESRDCTIKDITLMRNGFAPLREDGGGGNRYLRCVWALGPRPAGATEDPLVTNAADGMHMVGSSPGPDIEACVFRGVFLDDCIAIHGSFQAVTSASGRDLTLQGGAGSVRAGQPVRLSDPHGFFAQALVTAVKNGGHDTTLVTLDKDYGVPASAKLSNPQMDGAGFKIIGCHLGRTRSRGILAKADNGLIQNNAIDGCGMSAVSLGPEYYWGEADYVHAVQVKGNTIRGCGFGGSDAAIFVHGDGAVDNKDIVIEGNRLLSNYQRDMDLQWTDGLAVIGNTLTAPCPGLPDTPPRSPLRFADSRHITLTGNIVRNAAGYAPALVELGPDVTDFAHNDPTGIRPAPAP